MAAYAALLSLFHTSQQLLSVSPNPILPQTAPIRSLHQTVSSLLAFLDACSPNSSALFAKHEAEIRDAAYQAEDILESYIAQYFLLQSPATDSHFNVMRKALDPVTEKIAFAGAEWQRIPNTKISSDIGETSRRAISRGNKNFTVGIANALEFQILEQLAAQESALKVIPIVGMGGIGKTTLARTLFDRQLIVERFDIRAWVTISQEYRVQDIVNTLVDEVEACLKKKGISSTTKQDLRKTLYGRSYLIVLDDVWSVKAWEDIRMMFPDNGNASRIILTTRDKEVAEGVKSFGVDCHEMKLLDEDMSWGLFEQALFGQEGSCPSGLERIGREIVMNCKGLPLTIVVIAGLLSKKEMTEGYWEYIADNLKSVLTMKEGHCLDVLSLSYNYLPHHLKACFLYMGVFPEDSAISASKLIKLWIAEGFLKQVESKRLEEVAMELLQDLIDRNLILVLKHGINGEPKTCGIHDLLREICLREGRNEKFLYVLNRYAYYHPEEANEQRRLSVHPSVIEDIDSDEDDYGSSSSSSSSSSSNEAIRNGIEALFHAMHSMPFTRSFISLASFPLGSEFRFGSGLLRVFEVEKDSSRFPKKILDQINLRYIGLDHLRKMPSSVCRLWNLQTLIASDLAGRALPSGIWDMKQLRHIKVGNCYMPKCNNSSFLTNLQTLSGVMNFRCKKKIAARMPNLRRLKTTYDQQIPDWKEFHLGGFVLLKNLASLTCLFNVVPNAVQLVQNLEFPSSLKKLTLKGCRIPWEHMTIIGILPNLEVLKLEREAFQGSVWKPNEGEFISLRFLLIEKPVDLEHWEADDTHFPRLRHLVLRECSILVEIPPEIGDIVTLETIELYGCSSSAEESAREIQENNEIKLSIDSIKDGHNSDDGAPSNPSGNSSSSSGSSSSSSGSEDG